VVPRFRRWGALLTGALLVVFMVYVGVQYDALRGEDCSCFPWLERLVGPGFFIGDAIMLLLAVVAGVWTRPSHSLRSAVMVVGAVAVFALVSFGVAEARQTGVRAPETISVDGKPYSLKKGRVFLFFFHPECMHCFEAARTMGKAKWNNARVIGVPVAEPQFAHQFLADSGLNVPVTADFEKLKQVFGFPGYPYGVAIQDGRKKAALTKFADDEPLATLRKLGFVE
jgi:thiol-disulfide isomerase/thioredoxin